MQEDDDDFGVTNESTEILNLPLYTERKADGIYRYRRRVPKALRGRLGKGYLYRNLGRTKQEVVGKWPAAHAEIEQVLETALEGQSKAQELIRKKDHRATILHLVTQEYGSEAAQRLEAVSMAILGHGANAVAANYGSGYALGVMREHMEKAL